MVCNGRPVVRRALSLLVAWLALGKGGGLLRIVCSHWIHDMSTFLFGHVLKCSVNRIDMRRTKHRSITER